MVVVDGGALVIGVCVVVVVRGTAVVVVVVGAPALPAPDTAVVTLGTNPRQSNHEGM